MSIIHVRIAFQKQEITSVDDYAQIGHFVSLCVDENSQTGMHSSTNKMQHHHKFSQSTSRLCIRDSNTGQ